MLPLLASVALASEPVDIGVIKNEDIRVVQKVLYTKEGRMEIVYCGGCGKALLKDEFTKGQARFLDNRPWWTQPPFPLR